MVNPDLSLGALILEHPGCARILQKHRIDFCCRGDRTLSEACVERGIEPEVLLPELEAAAKEPSQANDLRSLPTSALIEHIVERHHIYLRDALPFVETLATKVARVHGSEEPNLIELGEVVAELRTVLEPHLDREEAELFPALLKTPVPDTTLAELDAMAAEHIEVGTLLARMRAAAHDYQVPEWACRSYRALFSELERLEVDVMSHVHAENHVLLPRYAATPASS